MTPGSAGRKTAAVAGADGCRGGWAVALWLAEAPEGREAWRFVVLRGFAEVLALRPGPAVWAVDVPIGLPEAPCPGGRFCDREARRLLGRPRASSVFTPPARCLLRTRSYEAVRGRGLNRQGFHLLPRIREVDALLDPARQERVREVHPELCFLELAGRAMRHPKRRAEGREERRRLLAAALGRGWDAAWREACRRLRATAAPDDLLDASVAAWTARRILEGRARRIPADPPRDGRGLRMAIWR